MSKGKEIRLTVLAIVMGAGLVFAFLRLAGPVFGWLMFDICAPRPQPPPSPDAWSQLDLGMTTNQVLDLLGAPAHRGVYRGIPGSYHWEYGIAPYWEVDDPTHPCAAAYLIFFLRRSNTVYKICEPGMKIVKEIPDAIVYPKSWTLPQQEALQQSAGQPTSDSARSAKSGAGQR